MNAPTQKASPLNYGLAWISILGGVFLLIFGITFLFDADESEDWPASTGKVLGTRVSYDLSSSAATTNRRSYYYTVTYDYSVEGQSYINDQFSIADNLHSPDRFNDEGAAIAAAERNYPVGADLNVYYNPENPEESVLVKGATETSYIPLLLGLLFFPAGLYLLHMVRSGQL